MVISKHLDEQREKIEIRFCLGQTEGVDFERGTVRADFNVRPFEQSRKVLEATAKVKNEGVGIIFLEICD